MVRNGIAHSLRPIRQRLGDARHHGMMPLSALFAPTTKRLEEGNFSPEAPYSMSLQPHPAYQTRTHISVGGSGFRNNAPLPIYYAATLAPSTVSATSGMSFLKFLLVFTAGGLFFSTAIAAVTACYAMGIDNVRRILELVTAILEKVWITFTLGLSATKLALLGKDEEQVNTEQESSAEQGEQKSKASWKWRSAWAVLKQQLGETRRTAAQGVQALKKEAKLYTAAVGPPGLIPLQYVVDRLMPMSLSTIMEESIRKSLAEFPKQKTIKKMTLSSFSAGNRPPVLDAARVYDVKNAMAFDYTVKWDSELDASVQIYTVGGLARVPVSLKNMKFEGTVRVVLTPLVKMPPGYGAILMSFAKPPKINMDIRVLGGELTKLPFLRYEITSAIQKAIADQLLWPRRAVIPTMLESSKRPLLSAKQLANLEKTDPLLEAEQALAEEPMLRSMHDTTTPTKGKRRMLRLTEGNSTGTVEDQTTKIIQSHHNVERGLLWGRLQNFFATEAEEETQTSNLAQLKNASALI